MKAVQDHQPATLEQILAEGFIWLRDDQMWGNCPTYRNPNSGEVRYHLNHKFVTRPVLERWLKEEWSVENAEENTWKWATLSKLKWENTIQVGQPLKPEEIRKLITELQKNTEDTKVKLQNPAIDTVAQVQMLEGILSNAHMIQGLKMALGAS